VETIRVTTEWTKFYTLLFLLAPIIFVLGVANCLNRTMERVIYVNVGTRTRVRSFNLLIDWSNVTAVECSMNSFFLDNFIFNIVFLFFMLILARSRVLMICLLCVWCFTFITPEVRSFCFWKETLWLLTYNIAFLILMLAIKNTLFNWYCCLVCSRPRFIVLNFSVFAVWNFRLEYTILTCRIKLFLT